jgi:hypothetical protein
LHFAAHSHHFWPDVSREAQLEYWDDCAKLSDEKWEKVHRKERRNGGELRLKKHP